MPAFSIATPINIKSTLQAIYASDEKCYALVKLDEFNLELEDESNLILLRNTCSVDANVALPLEVCVLGGVTAEWLQQHVADFCVYLDGNKLDTTFYTETSAEGKATLEKLYSIQTQLKCLYLQSGVSFKIADDNHELVRSVVEPTITDVTDNEKSVDVQGSSSSESDGVNEDSEESTSEDSVATMEFAIRLLENEDNLNACSVHAIYAWDDEWYVLADVADDDRFDELFYSCYENKEQHTIEQIYTVETDKMPASVEVYWVRYGEKGNELSLDIQRDVGAIKVAIDGIDVPTSSYASIGEKAEQTLKALYPHQAEIEALYLADLDDEHEASFSITPLDGHADEYQLTYRMVKNAKISLPEEYRVSKFEDVYNNQNASSVTALTIEELADGVYAEAALPASAQSEPPVVEEPADDAVEDVVTQSAPVQTPADECVSGMSSPSCPGLFSPRTWYAAGITLFAAGIYVGMKVLEQSSDQQQGPRI